jgi:hypothetical protein
VAILTAGDGQSILGFDWSWRTRRISKRGLKPSSEHGRKVERSVKVPDGRLDTLRDVADGVKFYNQTDGVGSAECRSVQGKTFSAIEVNLATEDLNRVSVRCVERRMLAYCSRTY